MSKRIIEMLGLLSKNINNKKYEEKKKKNKYAIFLVFLFKDISLWPDLSSPPRFRIQGAGTSVTQEGPMRDRRTEILLSDIQLLLRIPSGMTSRCWIKKKMLNGDFIKKEENNNWMARLYNVPPFTPSKSEFFWFKRSAPIGKGPCPCKYHPLIKLSPYPVQLSWTSRSHKMYHILTQ